MRGDISESVQRMLIMVIILSYAPEAENANQLQCSWVRYYSLHINGCINCKKCPRGKGLQKNCGYNEFGLQVKKPCLNCGQGYYQNGNQFNCQLCRRCGENEVTMRSCIRSQNTQCSPITPCPDGMYRKGKECIQGTDTMSTVTTASNAISRSTIMSSARIPTTTLTTTKRRKLSTIVSTMEFWSIEPTKSSQPGKQHKEWITFLPLGFMVVVVIGIIFMLKKMYFAKERLPDHASISDGVVTKHSCDTRPVTMQPSFSVEESDEKEHSIVEIKQNGKETHNEDGINTTNSCELEITVKVEDPVAEIKNLAEPYKVPRETTDDPTSKCVGDYLSSESIKRPISSICPKQHRMCQTSGVRKEMVQEDKKEPHMPDNKQNEITIIELEASTLLVEELFECQIEELSKRLDTSSMGAKNWKDLAVNVGAEQIDIGYWETAFKRDGSPTVCVINFLKSKRWKARQLMEGLILIGRKDVATNLCEHLSFGCQICHRRIQGQKQNKAIIVTVNPLITNRGTYL